MTDWLWRVQHYIDFSAVRRREQLDEWFTTKELVRMSLLGFFPVRLRADRILAESEHQVVAARREPLTDHSVRVGIEKLL